MRGSEKKREREREREREKIRKENASFLHVWKEWGKRKEKKRKEKNIFNLAICFYVNTQNKN